MKSAGAVYKKLKEAKYRYLVGLYKKYFRKLPVNCKYNYPYFFTDVDGIKREIRLCLFGQESLFLKDGVKPELLDVCEVPRHYIQCNAFAFKYTKEDIKNIFEKELLDKEIKTVKYPDICALDWVLERFTYESQFFSWIKKIITKYKNKEAE